MSSTLFSGYNIFLDNHRVVQINLGGKSPAKSAKNRREWPLVLSAGWRVSLKRESTITSMMSSDFLLYLKKKLFGRIFSVFCLAVAPLLWGLLAFNAILKDTSIPGAPLAGNSLTICIYRFIGAAFLGLLVYGAWFFGSLFLKRAGGIQAIPFLIASSKYVRSNWITLVGSSLLLSLALSAFFLSFEFLGVVMTNVIAVGLIPFCSLGVDYVRSSRLYCKLAGRVWHRPQLNGYDLAAYGMMLFTLFLFGLLTFDTVDLTKWPDSLPQSGASPCQQSSTHQFIPGLYACVVSAVMWTLFLNVTSTWPSPVHEDIVRAKSDKPTLSTIYLSELKERKEPTDKLHTFEILFIKVGLVQLIALIFTVLFTVLAMALHLSVAFGLKEDLFKITLDDLATLPARYHDFESARGWFLLMIVFIPSFGAYYFLNAAIAKYDKQKSSTGAAVTSEQWNNLLSFLEPLGACAIGISGLYYVGKALGVPNGLSEKCLYKFPDSVVVTVFISYTAVFVVKFVGIFYNIRRRDVHAYWQKLQKISSDALTQRPGKKKWEDYSGTGLKADDEQKIKQFTKIDPGLPEKFLDFEKNSEQQALVYLVFIAEWPFGCSYRTDKREKPGTTSLLEEIPGEPKNGGREPVWTVLQKNFGQHAQLQDEFYVYLLHFPGYAEVLPVHSYEWREVEKLLYFWLTGSTWFKMSRFSHELVGFGPTDKGPLEQRLESITRGFFKLVDYEAFTRRLPDTNPQQSWRDLLFPLAPHILDWDHMVQGTRDMLCGRPLVMSDSKDRVQIAPADKVLLLLVPKKEISVLGVKFKNPFRKDEKSFGADFAVKLHKQLIEMLNKCGGLSEQRKFKRQIYGNGFVFCNGLADEVIDKVAENRPRPRDPDTTQARDDS